MPRAFLITHRRYNGAVEELDGSERDYSPERRVKFADYGGGHTNSDGASDCGSETSSECPEELYNLTKLAEVSLAAAAGTLIHPNNIICQRNESPRFDEISKDTESPSPRLSYYHPHHYHHHHHRHEGDHFQQDPRPFEGRNSRFFFQRLENEGELLKVRISPIPHHHYSYYHRQCHPTTIDSDNPELGVDDENKQDSPSNDSTKACKLEDQSNANDNNVVDIPKSEDNEDHECPDCGKKYSTSSNLARHRQTHRSLGDKKARRCPHCDKVYVSMPAFSMHVRTHNQGCKCHYCGKCFSRPWLLQGHIRTHTGEKPFKCTICNKAFADKSNLRAHIQTHSNTKPHICERCGKAFALKSYLYKHEESSCMRAHHKSSEKNDSTEKKSSSTKTTAESSASKTLPIPCITSSPISVIVPRLGHDCESKHTVDPPAVSAIIRHTGISTSEQYSPETKRFCKEQDDSKGTVLDSPVSTNMVVRTSVISTNPEHLNRFGHDYKEPTNKSTTMYQSVTLNLAAA